MMDFKIDVKKIKIASGEEEISHTIEELLTMNKMIPAHSDEEIGEITETQLDNSDYKNKPSRGEAEGITEHQLGNDSDGENRVTQVQIEEAGETDGGHRPDAWDKDDEKIRGHKNVAPIWHEVYLKEDNRKTKLIEKNLTESHKNKFKKM